MQSAIDDEKSNIEQGEKKPTRIESLFGLGEMNFIDPSRQYYDMNSMQRTPMPLRLPTYVDTKSKVYSFLESSTELRSPRHVSMASPGSVSSLRNTDGQLTPRSASGFTSPTNARSRLNSVTKTISETGSVLVGGVPADYDKEREPETSLPPEERLYEGFVRFVASQLKSKIALDSRLQRLSEDRINTYASKYKGLKVGTSSRFGGQRESSDNAGKS